MQLTRKQVRAVDRIAIERYHVPGIVLMENAARGATDAALRLLRGRIDQEVLILCGGGNNGGDGLAIARHLHNHGVAVTVGLTIDPGRYTGDALINWQIVQAMQLPIQPADRELIRWKRWTLIVDAIFGTGLESEPRPPFPGIADAVNGSQLPVLAIDMPSGLDCGTGRPLGAAIGATETVTFVAEKIGFTQPGAADYTGAVTIVDIGCPRAAIEEALQHS